MIVVQTISKTTYIKIKKRITCEANFPHINVYHRTCILLYGDNTVLTRFIRQSGGTFYILYQLEVNGYHVKNLNYRFHMSKSKGL